MDSEVVFCVLLSDVPEGTRPESELQHQLRARKMWKNPTGVEKIC